MTEVRAAIRVLLGPDDAAAAAELAAMLREEQYDVRIISGPDGVLPELRRRRADLIVLDLRRPDPDGVAVCRAVRGWSTAGIIVLSECRGEDVKVRLLDHGADDYLVKPCGRAELVARLRAVSRRRPIAARHRWPAFLMAGPVEIDVEGFRATVAGRELDLPRKEFQLLELLVRNLGRTVTLEDVRGAVWGQDDDVASNTIAVHVKRLRGKIEPDPAAPRHLVTVRGVGYKYLP